MVLHGLMGHAREWDVLADALAERFHVSGSTSAVPRQRFHVSGSTSAVPRQRFHVSVVHTDEGVVTATGMPLREVAMQQHKAVVQAFVDAVNARDWDRLEALVAPDFVRHSDAAGEPGVRSRDDLVAFLQAECATFPDAVEEVEALIAEADTVAARHRFSGTQDGPLGGHPPTGRRLTARYLAMYRLEDGRLREAWAEWDNLTGLRQLGHLDHRDG